MTALQLNISRQMTARHPPASTGASTSPARRPRQTSGPDEWTVEELSEASGVSVRNIRAYQTAGLLPPPRLRGRLGLYDEQHLAKLSLIRDLRQQGFKLDTIKGLLDQAPGAAWGEYALIGQLFSRTFFTVERPQRKAIRDMAAHWGNKADEGQRARLTSNGLYRRLDGDHVEMLSPSLERIGIQLAELEVPLDLVLDLQDTLVAHARAIARAYVEQLFLTEAVRMAQQQKAGAQEDEPSADRKPGAPRHELPSSATSLVQLFERLRPLAIGSVNAAFPVLLQQEFEDALARRQQ